MGANTSQELQDARKEDEIRFFLHDKLHVVKTNEITPELSLNNYIRSNLYMTGTKYMCREGGCGCCVVVLRGVNPTTQKTVHHAVNSCLVPVLACSNLQIYTIEGIGNPIHGYHPLQTTLAKFNGTQCGFCSPGMVMTMYELYQSGQFTKQQVEDQFSGNICRCTGYRSILAAFKSLSTDKTEDCQDIEDLASCSKEEFVSVEKHECEKQLQTPYYHVLDNDSIWIKVYTLSNLLNSIRSNSQAKYRLVAGNTAKGVYSSYGERYDVYIDITSVPELLSYSTKPNNLVMGAGIILADAINIFADTAKSNTKFAYLSQVSKHIGLVANVPVRNRATLGGNLNIKHDHHEFPSDIFLLCATANVKVTIVDAITRNIQQLSVEDFINVDMKFKVLLNIAFPSYSSSYKFLTFKIMQRALNVHAIVNAGFLFNFDSQSKINAATIIYGNINNTFIHAKNAEKQLIGKDLFSNATVQQICKTLSGEVIADSRPPDPSPAFRGQLAIALFYKAVLSIAPASKLSPRSKSGGELLERPISTGTESYQTKQNLFPLTEAIPKIEALEQTSGQAKYIPDMPDLPYQLFGALLTAKARAGSKIQKIDAAKALAVDGIVAFYDLSSVIGKNEVIPPLSFPTTEREPVFCSGTVLYYDQPVGILVGKTEQLVTDSIALIHVTYQYSKNPPLLTIRQVIQSGQKDRIIADAPMPPKSKGSDVKHVVKGSIDLYQQYHFHMEKLTCFAIPTEDGLDVHTPTQWMDGTVQSISDFINVPNNKINIIVRRCGGGFGAKVSKIIYVACAVSLAAWKLQLPVRMHLTLQTNMTAIGKRHPFSMDYEAGVNASGVFQYLNSTIYSDLGSRFSEDLFRHMRDAYFLLYASDTFELQYNKVKTDTASNTFMRGPGSCEMVTAMESIIDHVAYVTGVDPVQVKLGNLARDSGVLKYIQQLMTDANVKSRQSDITAFNKANRWKKKGLAVSIIGLKFPNDGTYYATVAINNYDGTIQLSHGGIELGQGINTKAAQVCAYKLGISVTMVSVKPSNTFVGVNSIYTAISKTSEGVCYAISKACDILLSRIKPYRDQNPNADWKSLITICHTNFVELKASSVFAPSNSDVHEYFTYGACASEVLVDILTGQFLLTRTDVINDVGQSSSPLVDIGQIEGAFVMGLGYHTLEKVQFDEDGQVITNNTWTYYVPQSKDIPIDFRVTIPGNNTNPLYILGSKGVGEPPLCLTPSVPLAIRNALASARRDSNASAAQWVPIDGPTVTETIFMNALNDTSQYVL